MKLFRILLITVLAMCLTGILPMLSLAEELTPSLPNAIWTTEQSGKTVDKNLYEAKWDVFLNGGPKKLDNIEESYAVYIKVTNPSGSETLGSSQGLVEIGSGANLVSLWENLVTPIGTKGYNDTPNPGGEYKVWVSTDPSFSSAQTKFDNFKVKSPKMTEKLQLLKYYDTDADEVKDADEPYLDQWQFTITASNGETWTVMSPYADYAIEPGEYTITESMPLQSNWVPTGPTIVPTETGIVLSKTSARVTLDSVYNDVTVLFGNVYLGPNNGRTLGFWSNKNGQALIDGSDIQALVALNLRGVNGAPFDPSNYSNFRNWILNATATDMSYMLSAQLATMKLNVLNGFVPENVIVTTPFGFMTIGELMAKANLALEVAPFYRNYQEQLKNALDAANNNNDVYVLSPNNPFDFPYTF